MSSADRAPKPPERAKIVRALEGKFDCDLFPGASCNRKLRVSTKSQRWAAAYIDGKDVQPAVASLERSNHRWKIHQIGNGGGCDVPEKVVKDLHLACF